MHIASLVAATVCVIDRRFPVLAFLIESSLGGVLGNREFVGEVEQIFFIVVLVALLADCTALSD